MSHKLERFLDLFDVPIAFIATVTLLSIKEILGIIAAIITISYTIWKWIKEIRESKIKKQDE